MRYIFAIFLLFFVSCSIKPNTLALNSYKPSSSKISNEICIQKTYIKSIINTKKDKTIVALANNISNTYPLSTYTKTYNTLENGLKTHGHEIVKEPLGKAFAIGVAIEKYNNLKTALNIQLTPKKGFKKGVENILQIQKSFYENAPSKGEFETSMQTLANDMILQNIQKATSA